MTQTMAPERKQSMKTNIIRLLLPLVILAVGAGISRWVAKKAPTAERHAVDKPVPLVEVQPLEPRARKAVIEGTGLATPAQQVIVIPQVTGEVVHVSKAMVPGGRVKKGDLLVRIDPRDYKLAVEQQNGNLRSAELEVEREQAQQELAIHEWQVLGESGAPPPLFSRESQKAAAEANLGAGQRGLDRAKLNLSRTSLRAPFDATVISENVDLGQVVGPQSQLARLIGTDQMWVMVAISVEELSLISIPGVNAEHGSTVEVRQRLSNGKYIVRPGQVTRLVNQLDDRTRRAQVVVTVDDPFNPERGLPLLSGAHVQVAIEGQRFDQVYTLPRQTVYEGNVVWVMGKEDKLERRQVTVAWGDADNVYVTSGVAAGDRLVLTRQSNPIAGTKVAVVPPAGSAETTQTPSQAAVEPSPDGSGASSSAKPKQEVN